MAYRLALHLGHVNVDRMLGEISWRQFLEWIAFAELEPFDEERADIRAAQIVTAIANANRPKRRRPYSMREFVLRFGDSAPIRAKQTWQQMKAMGQMIAGMFNAESRRSSR